MRSALCNYDRYGVAENGSIPFDKTYDDDAMRADGLDPQWFGCSALMPSFT